MISCSAKIYNCSADPNGTTRIRDAINKKIGLNWSCESCRIAEDVKKKMVVQPKWVLSNFYSEFLEMGTKFNSLKVTDDPLIVPVSSPKEPPPKLEEETYILQPSTSTDLMLNLNSPTPSCSSRNNTKRKTSVPGNASTPILPTFSSCSNGFIKNSSLLTLPAISPPITVQSVKPLVAVKSNDGIKSNILSKFPTENLVVEKFNFKLPSKISSFKVSISAEHFPIVCNASYWTPDLILKEFTSKQKTHTPVSLPSLSVVPPNETAKNLKHVKK